MMSKLSNLLHGTVFCALSVVVGIVVCGVGGALIGQGLIQEEARGLVEGGTLGAGAGAVLGLGLGLVAVLRRRRGLRQARDVQASRQGNSAFDSKPVSGSTKTGGSSPSAA